jgi:putative NADH-flavin reductase
MHEKKSQMKVIIFGASGNLGKKLVTRGIELGYLITAFVRKKDKIEKQFNGKLPANLTIIEGDIFHAESVGNAIGGHGYLINAAGYAADSNFFDLCQIVLKQAVKNLENPKRVWFLGGAAALDFGSSGIMGVDCPGVPKIYLNHKKNYEALLRTNLDWSFMCPGPMVESPHGELTNNLRISVNEMPYEYPKWLTRFPRIALSLTMKQHVPEIIVSYDDVANIIMTNLEASGIYSQKRVGVALPKGMKGVKENY